MPAPLALDVDETLVRTDFSNEDGWREVVAILDEPMPFIGEPVPLNLIDDKQYDGLDAAALLALLPEEHASPILLVADHRTMDEADHPILVVDLVEEPGRSFRVVASEAWGPVSNLPISNMDWDDFTGTLGADGIHRGFSE